MPAISKSSISSHTEMVSKYFLLQLSMMKSKTQSWGQAIPILNIFNVVLSRVLEYNGVEFSDKNQCQFLVPKAIINSDLFFRKSNNGDTDDFSNWILVLAIIGYLQEPNAEILYFMTVFMFPNMLVISRFLKPAITGPVFLQDSLEIKLGKYPGRFSTSCVIRKTVDICSQQMPTEANRFSKYKEFFHVSLEMSARFVDRFNMKMPLQNGFLKDSGQGKLPKVSIPIEAPNDLVLHIKETYKRRAEMKCQGVCYLCQLKIKGKKFFRDRRYGILSNCECMICYGCIRDTVDETAWVKESVVCPVCSVESDTFASSHKWIEGQDKTDFFRTYNENMKTVKVAMENRPDMKTEGLFSEPEDKQLSNCMEHFVLKIFT